MWIPLNQPQFREKGTRHHWGKLRPRYVIYNLSTTDHIRLSTAKNVRLQVWNPALSDIAMEIMWCSLMHILFNIPSIKKIPRPLIAVIKYSWLNGNKIFKSWTATLKPVPDYDNHEGLDGGAMCNLDFIFWVFEITNMSLSKWEIW